MPVPRLLQFIIRNWKLKLLSLLLAVMLWFTVFLIGEMKRELRIPVTLTNLGKEYLVAKIDLEKVDVTVTGRVAILKDVKDTDIKVTVNLSNPKEGENIFNLSKTNVEVPRGVQVGQIKPSSLRIDIDRIVEKRLKTVVQLDPKWTRRYAVKSWSPGFITVEGPKRIWGDKTFIETNPVTGDFKRDEETVMVPLNTEGLSAIKIDPGTVRVILRRQSGKETIWN